MTRPTASCRRSRCWLVCCACLAAAGRAGAGLVPEQGPAGGPYQPWDKSMGPPQNVGERTDYGYPIPRLPSEAEMRAAVAPWTAPFEWDREFEFVTCSTSNFQTVTRGAEPQGRPTKGLLALALWDTRSFFKRKPTPPGTAVIEDYERVEYALARIGYRKAGADGPEWGVEWSDLLRTAAERQARIEEFLAARTGGAEPAEEAGPERPVITVGSARVVNGRLVVSYSVKSRSPIVSKQILRVEGGGLAQGHTALDGAQGTSECDVAPGVANVFKISVENADGLGAEYTIRLDATGQVAGAETTSGTGDVTVKDEVPGMAGIGDVPGPSTPTQGALGVLLPTLAAGLLRILLGGAGAPPTRTPRAPSGPPPGAGRGPDGPKGATSLKEPPPAPPPAPPLDPATAAAMRTMQRLANLAVSHRSQGLADAVRQAGRDAFGPDGKVDPAKWTVAKEGLRRALTAYEQAGESPTWVAADAARAAGHAVWTFGGEFGKGLGNLALGIGAVGWQAAAPIHSPLSSLREAGQMVAAAAQSAGDWIETRAPQAARELDRAWAAGRVVDVAGHTLGILGQASTEAACGAARFVANDILPVEEARSLFGTEAGFEERAWALAASAAKVASLATMFVTPSVQPSTSWGAAIERTAAPYLEGLRNQGLHRLAQEATQQAAALEARIPAVEQLAARQTARGGLAALPDSMRRTAAAIRVQADTARAAIRLDTAVRSALTESTPLGNYPQVQRFLAEHPQVADAAAGVVRANNGTNAFAQMRAAGLVEAEVHTVATAAKLRLQDQAVNSAMKRIVTEEVEARLANGQPVPRRFHGANATQGSRTNLSGANFNVDNDHTAMGLANVSRERQAQIVQEECSRLGVTQHQLDINIYSPQRGLSDAAGAAANGQATLENIMQTTGRSSYHQVHVTRDGRVVVSDMIQGQGREAVLYGRESLATPAKLTRQEFLWEGHQGAPIHLAPADLPAARAAQMRGFRHAFEKGEMNQMCKYANRDRIFGGAMSRDGEALVRAVCGQKDPYASRQLMAQAGVTTPQELARYLGMAGF